MKCLISTIFVIFAVNGGGGVTQQKSGIDQFWTDDYKLFEQIYGRTSDRDLYRAAVPVPVPTYQFNAAEARHLQNNQINQISQASEKKEKIYEYDDYEPSAAATQDSYLGHYANLVNQQTLKTIEKDISKPTKPTFKFVGYNEFKPISQSNDPETYNYLKHLELLSKKQSIGFPQEGVSGFKPTHVSVYPTANPEETDAYKSIQDILDAHEASKEKEKKTRQKHVKDIKYVTYGQGRNLKKPSSIRYVHSNDISRPSRCVSGRCSSRKRVSRPRVRSRPVITRIKHRVYSD